MSCRHVFKTKNCSCFAPIGTNYPNENQVCAFQENNRVFPCDKDCCEGGCPGQTPNVKPRPPFAIKSIMKTTDKQIKNIFKYIVILLVWIYIISTILIFI